jgi:hypothetical protein
MSETSLLGQPLPIDDGVRSGPTAMCFWMRSVQCRPASACGRTEGVLLRTNHLRSSRKGPESTSPTATATVP